MSNILLTTTDILQNKEVEYIGLVSSEIITGLNVFKDFEAGVKNFFGGRINSYESSLIEMKKAANQELIERALQLNSRVNAVIGIDYDFVDIGKGNSSFALVATGTAVIYR